MPQHPASHKFLWQLIIIAVTISAIILALILQFTAPAYTHLPLIIAIIAGGIPAVLQIVMKLIKGDLGADSLAALAIITAVILNQYLAAVIVILMVASGQALEAYAMRKASSVLHALSERMPAVVHVKINDTINDIPLIDVKIGDEVVIYPHETCPVDGIVTAGQGSMDESYLTGEPYLISKAPGTQVLSGAINGESLLTCKAQKLPSDSRYASIVAVLQEAEQKRPTIRRLGDQIGSIFAPISLILAIGAWYYSGDAVRFLAVLVIATPCPLLIAIPITLISAISQAAKQSIIIKDPVILEKLPTCKTAIFDKTGTLTYGKPVLTEIITTKNVNSDTILQYTASLERYSKHPLANAILKAAEKKGLSLLVPSNVSEKSGQGLSGVINQHTLHITHRKYILDKLPQYKHLLPPIVAGLECVILFDNDYAATMHFRDAPRTDSKSFISHLGPAHQFNKIMLVSGDRESEVKYLASLLNLTEIHASQTPEQKLAIVRAERKEAPTLFIGDGINDAPALTAATVGVAFGQYSNVTAESAGAVIMDSTLTRMDELIHLSLAARNIALQSAIGGMLLSTIGMGFAAAGFITPVAGAILQEIIDVLAIINSLKLIWGQKIKTDITNNK